MKNDLAVNKIIIKYRTVQVSNIFTICSRNLIKYEINDFIEQASYYYSLLFSSLPEIDFI